VKEWPAVKFLIAIEPGTDTTAYRAVVPDLPGWFSASDTLKPATRWRRP
jgi:hypothetical protein